MAVAETVNQRNAKKSAEQGDAEVNQAANS